MLVAPLTATSTAPFDAVRLELCSASIWRSESDNAAMFVTISSYMRAGSCRTAKKECIHAVMPLAGYIRFRARGGEQRLFV